MWCRVPAPSAVGLALQEAIEKHNSRNPGKEIIYLNYAAQAPQMTNARCSYWHFRTDANSDMKVAALTSYLAGQKQVKQVFLLNPNYAYGQKSRAPHAACWRPSAPT